MKRKRNGNAPREASGRAYSLALVGDGPSGVLLTGILARAEFTETFPWVKLAGVVAPPDGELAAWAGAVGRPLFADCAALFAEHPDLDMACDLTRDGSGLTMLRASSPPGCALISERTVRRFCEAIADGAALIGGGARLRAARNMFSSLMDQVDQDILVLDAGGRVLECNEHFLEAWGGKKIDYIGRYCDDVALAGTGAGDAAALCPYQRVVDSGEKVFSEFTALTEDGRLRHFRVIAFPVMRDEKRMRRVVLMRSDITSKVQLEQRLQQSEKMAAIGELSTYIAHEIRNPLFAIGGFANSLLRSPSLDDPAREKVRIILEESRRLDEILKSIINFARPTDQAVAEVDVNAVASQTVELMGIGGAERRIDLSLTLDRSLPRVRGNAEMLKQCLINIIKNAQEALPEEGGTIRVSTALRGTRVHLEVEDSGVGIPPELHERIFSPFFSTKDKGAGLGLAMTRKIIEEMGGKVILNSQVGKGTTITLALQPVLAVDGANAP